MVISRAFNMDLRTQVKQIVTNQYGRLNKNTWWRLVAKEMQSSTAIERLTWFIENAQIRREDDGSVTLEDLAAKSAEFEAEFASAGLKIKRKDLEDVIGGIPGGKGMDQAAAWARQIGALITYWPQKEVARLIRANPTAYDDKALFAIDHPVNPFLPAAGTYANLITAAVLDDAGLGSDEPCIHQFGTDAVDVDTALANISRVMAYVATIKQANGKDPRNLTPEGLLVPPSMRSRVQQLTKAKFIAQATGSGGGSGDVESVIADMNLGVPAIAPELGASFGSSATGDGVGSDTDWYIRVSGEGEEMAAVAWVNREPFRVTALTGETDAELMTAREFLWEAMARNVAGPGHPYQLIKVSPTITP